MELFKKVKGKIGGGSSLLTVICALIIEIIFFSTRNKYFFSASNFLNSIGLYAAIIGCVSCSITFVNISGMIDISVGSQIAVVGMVGALASSSGMPWYSAVLLAIASGIACGVINGFCITVLKLNAFITSIATMQTFRGIAYLVSDGMSITISDSAYKWVGRGFVFGLPVSLIILVISLVIFHIVSKYTVFGRNVYLIGGNPQASFLSGIKVNKTKFIIYLLNGLMCGVAGVLMSAQTGAGIPFAAANYNMTALSAVILGGAALTGGKGTILGTFLGIMVIAVLQNGMTMMGVGSYWQDIIIGLVLVISISIDAIKGGSLKRKL